jgi:hypothetical protein
MSTDTAEATTTEASENGKGKRGGPRGPRPWKDTPTKREDVLGRDLAKYIKRETGRDVSPETIRAVRYCLPKWNTSEETKSLREDMDKKIDIKKLNDKRKKALEMLREAKSELMAKYGKDIDLGELEEDEEDIEDDSDVEDVDDSTDEDEDEDDVFGDESETDSGGKVSASFG